MCGSSICHRCIVLTLSAIWLTVPVNKSHKRTAINASASSGPSSNESDKESGDSSSSELSDSEDDDLNRLANNAPKALADALAKEVNIPFHLALIMMIQFLYLSVQSGRMIQGQLPLLKSTLPSTKNHWQEGKVKCQRSDLMLNTRFIQCIRHWLTPTFEACTQSYTSRCQEPASV